WTNNTASPSPRTSYASRTSPLRASSMRMAELGRLLDGLVRLVVRVRAAARDERRPDPLGDRLLGDHALRDVATRRQLEHDVEERAFDDRPQPTSAGLARQRLVGDLPQRVVGEHELDAVVPEEAVVLLRQCVLRRGEDLHEILTPQLVHGG